MSAATLSPADRQRLASICGLLDSGHDGESLAAARKATAFLRARGMSWRDAIEAPPQTVFLNSPAQAAYRPSPPPSPPRWREHVTDLLQRPAQLSVWELDFLSGVRQRRQLTEKQADTLSQIIERWKVGAR